MARKKIINPHGTTDPVDINIGNDSQLEYGEIAINYDKDAPNLFIRTSDDNITSIKDMVHAAEYSLTAGDPTEGLAAIYYLTKNGEKVGDTINIPKDQFLEKVEYLNSSKKLVFTFITSTGKTVTEINVNDFAKIYQSGNGINMANDIISAKVVSGNGLSLDEEGIKMALASNGTPGSIKEFRNESFNAAADEPLVQMNLTNGIVTLKVSDTIDCGEY